MDTSALENIGLTKSEIKVYLTLLETGPTSTGPLVDRSGISSSKVYEILERLISKGLVSYVMRGRVKYFEAGTPKRIMDYMEDKERMLREQKERVKYILPKLAARRGVSEYRHNVTIFRGLRGLKTVFYESLDLMKPGEEVHVMGVPPRSGKVNLFFVNWNKVRARKNVRFKIVFDETARGEAQTKVTNSPISEIRFHPKGMVTPAAINLFKGRTVIFPAETEQEPMLIVIDSKEITDSFEAQFQSLWRQAAK
jgi:sugar-specific transcriptional regulator TrmB